MQAKPAKKQDAEAELPIEGGAGSVDKIRDILFGSQIKNYEQRFARLEDTLARETSDLKETMRKRFESLEGFFKRETEALAARLKAEREERAESLKALSRELKSSSDELAKKIANLDNKSSEAQSALRQELMAESRKLMEEIRQRHDHLTRLLEQRAGELRHDKTDRAELASILTELAIRINEDQEPARKNGKRKED